MIRVELDASAVDVVIKLVVSIDDREEFSFGYRVAAFRWCQLTTGEFIGVEKLGKPLKQHSRDSYVRRVAMNDEGQQVVRETKNWSREKSLLNSGECLYRLGIPLTLALFGVAHLVQTFCQLAIQRYMLPIVGQRAQERIQVLC